MSKPKHFYGYKISRAYRRLTLFIFDAKTHERIGIREHVWFPHFTKDERKKFTEDALREVGIPV